ncbi:MAG: BamA/TamA family outer membrane protein [Candidatus Eiseniibacteriota bacterium]
MARQDGRRRRAASHHRAVAAACVALLVVARVAAAEPRDGAAPVLAPVDAAGDAAGRAGERPAPGWRVITRLPEPDAVLWEARPVVAVDIVGDVALSGLTLTRAAAAPTGRSWTGAVLAGVCERLLAAEAAAGYLEARVVAVRDEPEGVGIRAVFEIDEGPYRPLAACVVRGATLFDPREVLELCGLRIGRPFEPAAFERGISDLLGRYENRGRPFATVEPEFAWRDDGLQLVVEVREGPLVEVGRLEVRGNRVTRRRVIERLAGIERGVPFAQRDLERARSRLVRSGLFAAVEPIGLAQDVDRTQGVLVVTVREGNPNRAIGVLGYSGSEQGLTGLFDLELGNIAGTGRRAHARWEGRGNGVGLFRLDYAEPWVLGTPITLAASLGRTVQDTLYTLSDVELVGELELTPDWSVGLGWERESTVQTLGEVIGTARNALVVRTDFDARDSRTAPRTGWRVAVESRLARKRLRFRDDDAPDASVALVTAEFGLERPHAWTRHHVTLVRLRGQGIISDEGVIPFYELYPLGGATSLRGYREEQFRGSRVGLLTVEQRFQIDAAGSRIAGFTDIGVVSTSSTALTPAGGARTLFKVGYGVGLRLETRLGLVGVDYGLGEGDGPLDGKIHFLLEAAF